VGDVHRACRGDEDAEPDRKRGSGAGPDPRIEGERAAEDDEQHAGREQVVARCRPRLLSDERVVEDVQDREPRCGREHEKLAISDVAGQAGASLPGPRRRRPVSIGAPPFDGRIVMQLIDRLDAARRRWNVLEHPFYRRWECGELSRDELTAYAGE
jgi:hypothetical protein